MTKIPPPTKSNKSPHRSIDLSESDIGPDLPLLLVVSPLATVETGIKVASSDPFVSCTVTSVMGSVNSAVVPDDVGVGV